MIEATVGMAAMALLFVVFGALGLAERGGGHGAGGGCGGSCGSCTGACGLESMEDLT